MTPQDLDWVRAAVENAHDEIMRPHDLPPAFAWRTAEFYQSQFGLMMASRDKWRSRAHGWCFAFCALVVSIVSAVWAIINS